MDEPRRSLHRRHLVELYQPGLTKGGLEESTWRVQAAARRLTGDGRDVRFMSGIFVPDDEAGLCLFEADTRETVAEACRRGGLRFDRILEVTVIPAAGATTSSRGATG